MKKALGNLAFWGGVLFVPPLVFAAGLAGLIAFLTVLHFVGPPLFVGGLMWVAVAIAMPSAEKKAQGLRPSDEARQRIGLLIQSHLVAHQLPNTPENRTYVLNLLNKPAPRGRRR